LKCCKNWLAISRPLESKTTHFRNTGTNKGKEYSTIQMVLYGCNELKRAHLNWVDPILALHTFAHGIVCISYLFISFHIFSQMAGIYCNYTSNTVQRSWDWYRQFQHNRKYGRRYVRLSWIALHNQAQVSKWWSSWDSAALFFCFWEGSSGIWQWNAQNVDVIIHLYEPGSLPVHEPMVCVGFLSHVLCRVPLIPCYMDGS